MTKKFDIVTIGDCLVDHYIEPEDFKIIGSGTGKKLALNFAQKIPARHFIMFPGGNALNVAVGTRRLGLATAIMTDIGLQDESELVFNRITKEGIDTALVQRRKATETDKSVVFVTRGERTAITYHCKKNYQFNPKFQSKWIYLTSLGIGFERIYAGVEKYKKSHSAKVAFNPGSRQLKHSLEKVRKMIHVCDLLFVNLPEARMITGKKTNDAKILMRQLFFMGSSRVVITDGSKGAFAFDGDLNYRIGSFPAKRIDATGAGDAFASSFISAIIQGKVLSEAILWGSINAASEIGHRGVQNGLLDKTEIQKILAKSKKYLAKKF